MLPDQSPNHHYTLPSLGRGMRKVTDIALPSMGSFILNHLQNVIIGLSIGTLHDADLLASVGLGSLVANLLGFSIGIGLLSVLDSLIAQSAGAKNTSLATLQLTRGRVVVILITIPCTIAMLMSGKLLLMVGQDPIACAYSQLFVTSSALGLLPAFLFTADAAFLRGFHVTLPILFVNIACSVFQVALCVFMVNYMSWGLWGAGLSTSLANWARFVLLQLYMQKSSRHPETAQAASFAVFLSRLGEATELRGLFEFVALAVPSAGIMWCEWWVYELQAVIAGWLGIQALAAHVVCCNIEVLIYMIPLGVQQAAAVLVGNSLGAGRPKMAIQYSQLTMALGTVIAICVSYLVIQYRGLLSGIYSIDSIVLSQLDSTLMIVAAYHILAAINCVFEGILRGMRLQGKVVMMKVIAMIVYQLPVAYYLSTRLGLNGVWYASISGLILTLMAYTYVLRRANIQECAILVMKENLVCDELLN